MNEELDSQLSAMFDDELAPAECELLARRLSRDELLKARWGRYAVIGAAIRSEGGVRLNAPLAGRVSALVRAEPVFAGNATAHNAPRSGLRWWQPLAGGALAAGVAAASILWLRGAGPALTAQVSVPATRAIADRVVDNAPRAADSYVVPKPPAVHAMVPSTDLANYVVAHSMVSTPMARRNLLSAFMSGESGGVEPTLTAEPQPPELPSDVR